jgi:hypothetical protein
MSPKVTFWLGLMTLLFGVILMLTKCDDANAHSWYDAYCCNAKDCKELKPEEVTEDSDRYIVIINGGIAFEIPKDSPIIRPSQDANYHLCILPNNPTPRCFYVPLAA